MQKVAILTERVELEDQGVNTKEMRGGGSLWPSTKFCLVCSCSSRNLSFFLAEVGRGSETLKRVLRTGVERKGKAGQRSLESGVRVWGSGAGASPGTGPDSISFPNKRKLHSPLGCLSPAPRPV